MTQKTSIKLADMTLAQLIQVNQGLGHDIERLREQRKYMQAKIAERLAAGESEHPEGSAEAEPAGDAGDAAAPGATIVATSSD